MINRGNITASGPGTGEVLPIGASTWTSKAVYWDPIGAALGVVVVGVVLAAGIARMLWDLSTSSAGAFIVERSVATEKTNARCTSAVRAHIRWRNPDWDSSGWIHRFSNIQVASPCRPRFRSYVVPRWRISGVVWIPNEIWPA